MVGREISLKPYSLVLYSNIANVSIKEMQYEISIGITISPICLHSCVDTLCEEGKAALDKLLKFMVHPAISSINLTTALGSLATLARQRPMFMSEVVQSYETLHGESVTIIQNYSPTSRMENPLQFDET